MKLTNNQIYGINDVLSEIVNEKVRGSFKFKLFKTKFELESAVMVVQKMLEGVTDVEERKAIVKDIEEETQDLNIELFTEDELEQLPLSVAQLFKLQVLIKEEGDK